MADILTSVTLDFDAMLLQHTLMRVLYVRFGTSNNAQEAARVYRILTRFTKNLIPNSLDNAAEIGYDSSDAQTGVRED